MTLLVFLQTKIQLFTGIVFEDYLVNSNHYGFLWARLQRQNFARSGFFASNSQFIFLQNKKTAIIVLGQQEFLEPLSLLE